MDSAAINNLGQGQAAYVEECRCPAGYSGLSCEVRCLLFVKEGHISPSFDVVTIKHIEFCRTALQAM
jgi:hypothetical protein